MDSLGRNDGTVGDHSAPNDEQNQKTCSFPRDFGTGCHFSIWRAVGGLGSGRNMLDIRAFFHSAPFPLLARCAFSALR